MGTLPSAGQAAGASNIFSMVGTGLNAAGQYQAGVAQSQMYNYQAQVAANNAVIERANASSTLAAGSLEESVQKTRTGQTNAAARAAQASNGLDINVGSPVATRESSALVGDLDAALIHYNASRAAFGQQQQAANYDTQSQLDRMAASNAKQSGALKAADTLLAGASSLSSKWRQFALAGAK